MSNATKLTQTNSDFNEKPPMLDGAGLRQESHIHSVKIYKYKFYIPRRFAWQHPFTKQKILSYV